MPLLDYAKTCGRRQSHERRTHREQLAPEVPCLADTGPDALIANRLANAAGHGVHVPTRNAPRYAGPRTAKCWCKHGGGVPRMGSMTDIREAHARAHSFKSIAEAGPGFYPHFPNRDLPTASPSHLALQSACRLESCAGAAIVPALDAIGRTG